MPDNHDASIKTTLADRFGFSSFREGQEEVIKKLLAGHSALAVFPTGGGKSLCYQLPALHLPHLTIVVSPLIALMKDQIDALLAKKIPAARLDSTLSWEETKNVYDRVSDGSLRLLYLAPERLGNARFLQRLERIQVSLLAVDEAHCISEWGHNFRPDYMKLAQTARQLNVERVLALTATATPQVAADICAAFAIAKEQFVQTSYYRSNLTLRLTPCPSSERDQALLTRLRDREIGPTIIYVSLQKTAQRVAEFLRSHDYQAQAYHAGMKPDARNEVQDWFMRGNDTIVVATIAFGMGIDKNNIRYVYHYNLPKSPENYAQEIGRAGRDELESTCEILAAAEDVTTLENFTYGDTPSAQTIDEILRALLALDDTFEISTYDWSYRHDVRQLVLSTLLTYLELQEVIETRGIVYNEYKFKARESSAAILARFDSARADFLRKIFRCARKGRTWLTLNLPETAEKIQEPRDRIARAFTHLEQEGLLQLMPSQRRQVYHFKNRPVGSAVEELSRQLTKRFHDSEKSSLDRLRRVVEMIENQGCVTRYLLAYFGEEMKTDCGHCHWCLGARPGLLPRMTMPDLSPAAEQKITRLLNEHHTALAQPRQVARFLCGIHSPASSRAKLPKHPLFGAYGQVPFAKILARVEEMLAG